MPYENNRRGPNKVTGPCGELVGGFLLLVITLIACVIAWLV